MFGCLWFLLLAAVMATFAAVPKGGEPKWQFMLLAVPSVLGIAPS